jgi:hypothetical protein
MVRDWRGPHLKLSGTPPIWLARYRDAENRDAEMTLRPISNIASTGIDPSYDDFLALKDGLVKLSEFDDELIIDTQARQVIFEQQLGLLLRASGMKIQLDIDAGFRHFILKTFGHLVSFFGRLRSIASTKILQVVINIMQKRQKI